MPDSTKASADALYDAERDRCEGSSKTGSIHVSKRRAFYRTNWSGSVAASSGVEIGFFNDERFEVAGGR
jgi:hypothetical protein